MWLDKEKINPGLRWKQSIRNAIGDGAFYIAMFSKNWEAKERTYANEELVSAIEQLRLRPTNRAWFIPVRLDDCSIPDRDIGAGETIRSIQYVDFPTDSWGRSLKSLLNTLGVENPVLELGEPLGTGLPSNAKLGYGRFVIGAISPDMPLLRGMVFTITKGWVTRSKEQHLLAYMETQAPNSELQKVNEYFGLANFYAISTDGYISERSDDPNTFSFQTDRIFPAGSQIYDLAAGQYAELSCDVRVTTSYVAKGLLSESRFVGVFNGELTYDFAGTSTAISISGEFDIAVEPSFDADPKVAAL